MVTRAIQLTEEEADSLREFAQLAGEDEETALTAAALRGLREYRLDRAFAAYREHGDSYRAAAIAGLPRAAFLWELAEHGEIVLQGPSTIAEDLGALAEETSDARLARAASRLAGDEHA